MAKKRRGGKSSKKTRTTKRKAGRKVGRAASMSPTQKKKIRAARVRMHQAASLLKDFHGGKLPLKSGCGRPRGS